MNKKRTLFPSIFFSALFVLFTFFLVYELYREAEAKEATMYTSREHDPSRQAALHPKTYIKKITLGAIGDILIHDWVYNDAKTAAGYDFDPMFKKIQHVLQGPDLLLANQETILGGAPFVISSYPLFNSPQEVGDSLVKAGIDIVSTANNHSLDKGAKGLMASLDYMDAINLPHVGTSRSREEQQTLTMLSVQGIKVAYLSYTYGTNGIPVPEGKDYLVNLIDKDNLKNEIRRAREKADVVVMSLHWGNEYQRFQTDDQKNLGQFVVNEGVDILFGHHPHVLQPMEWVQADDGRKALIVYSLGNFLSGQMWDYKDIGGMATVEVWKTIDSSGSHIQLLNPNFYPTYVSNENLRQYQVVPLQEADQYGLENADIIYSEIQEHMLKGLFKE